MKKNNRSNELYFRDGVICKLKMHFGKNGLGGGILFILLSFFQNPFCHAVNTFSSASETKLKLAYLINFAKLVEWPVDTFDSPISPILMSIFNEDAFRELISAVDGELAQGRPIQFVSYAEAKNKKNCHIVYLNISDSFDLKNELAHFKGQPTLTVGESEEFIRFGGMINFITKNKKLTFQFNLNSAQVSRLVISSRLIKLGEVKQP